MRSLLHKFVVDNGIQDALIPCATTRCDILAHAQKTMGGPWQYSVVAGHFGWPAFYITVPRSSNISCFTVTRKPVSRVISCYYYRYPNAPAIHTLSPKALQHFLLHKYSIFGEGCNNEVVRIFSGMNVESSINTLSENPDLMKPLVEQAKRNMNQCLSLIYEDLITNSTADLLNAWFPWLGYQGLRKENVGKRSAQMSAYEERLPEELLDVIMKANAADMELYRHALLLNEQQKTQLETMGDYYTGLSPTHQA